MPQMPFLPGLLILSACGSSTFDPAADPAEATRSRLAAMVGGEVPGVQYVVVDARGVRFEAALGARDVATRAPMQRDTLQMAYSVSKAVTAMAALKLVEQGKLELDAPLTRYFAEHPYGEAVTIRMLLAQTSGVPNPMPLDWLALEGQAFDRNQLLAQRLREHAELDHEPGSEYGYSNLSYWLLERAIEGASGRDYADYVTTNLFEPASITTDQASFSLGPPARSAVGHARRYAPLSLFVSWLSPSEYWLEPVGSWRRSARVVPHGRGHGGLFTNAAALGELLRDLLRDDPRVLHPETRKLMFTQQRTSDGEAIDMTLGWVVGELDGARYFGKQGGGLGFHGNVRVYPELGIATVLLANRTELTAGPIDERSNALDQPFVVARRKVTTDDRRTISER